MDFGIAQIYFHWLHVYLLHNVLAHVPGIGKDEYDQALVLV